MLMISWNSREAFETPEPCEPQYSPILDKMVEAGILEVRHVDRGGRMGKRVANPDGQPLWVSVDAQPTDLRFLLPGPGRYAVVARDHQGRHLGRNDILARENGQPDPWRQPTAHEQLKDELARERERRRAAEDEVRAAREQALQAKDAVAELLAQHERMTRELREALRLAEQRRVEAESERRRRREAEEAGAAAEKKVREQKNVQPGLTQKDLARLAMTAIPIAYYAFRRIKGLERKLEECPPAGDTAEGDAAERPARQGDARPPPSSSPGRRGRQVPIAPET